MPLTQAEFDALKTRYAEKAWAHVLQLRHERGEAINIAQQRCYRAALGLIAPANGKSTGSTA